MNKDLVLKRQRDQQLGRCITDLFNYHTLLYIGIKIRWNYPTFRGQDKFDLANYEIDILEKNPNTVMKLKKIQKEGYKFLNAFRPPPMFRTIYEGDVINIKSIINKTYDIVMWWQGPEHLRLEELKPTLGNLFSLTRKLLILGCPCGLKTRPHPMAEKEKYRNSLSAHYSILSPQYFQRLKFKTDIVGDCEKRGNNMLSYKRKNA